MTILETCQQAFPTFEWKFKELDKGWFCIGTLKRYPFEIEFYETPIGAMGSVSIKPGVGGIGLFRTPNKQGISFDTVLDLTKQYMNGLLTALGGLTP